MLWEQTINAVQSNRFIEMGPGDSLTKFIKRIKDAAAAPISTLSDLQGFSAQSFR